MHPVATKGGGTCFVFPNVCMTPAAPAPLPIPYPNIARPPAADSSTCSKNVKIKNKFVLVNSSEISRSQGDEAGVQSPKGTVSGTHMDKAAYKNASSKVNVEGSPVVLHLATTAHNGSNANAPPGTQVAPSQMTVFASS